MMRGIVVVVLFSCLILGGTLSASADRESEPNVESMIGQMFMFGFRGTGETNTQTFMGMLKMISKGEAGGVILFSTTADRNILNPVQLAKLTARLQAAAPVPLFIVIDQEGGKVQRLTAANGFKNWPSANRLGQMSEKEIYDLAFEMGQHMRSVGINVNLAPSLDLNLNPKNPVIGALGRSFSSDPQQVINKSTAFMRGMEDAGIISCFKHFPGHGSSATDTHHEITDITAYWKDIELLPFKAFKEYENRHMIMVGHLMHRGMDKKFPASLSKSVINGVLRNDVGWQGVVITDELQMRSIAAHYSLEEVILLTVNAGTDILLFGNDKDIYLPQKAYAAMLKLYREGKISKERIFESYQRIMRLKASLYKDFDANQK